MPAVIPIIAGVVAAGAAAYGGYMLWQRYAGPDGLPSADRPGLPDPNKPNGGGDQPVVEVVSLDELVGLYPNGGFHDTIQGNSLSGTATGQLNRIVPGAGNSPPMVRAVKRIYHSGQYNRELYGIYDPDGDIDTVEGYHIRRAYLPRHENAIEVMRAGFKPRRYIDAEGRMLPGSPQKHGRPWLAPLHADAVRAGITDPAILVLPNADGSPGIDPPASFWAELRERPA